MPHRRRAWLNGFAALAASLLLALVAGCESIRYITTPCDHAVVYRDEATTDSITISVQGEPVTFLADSIRYVGCESPEYEGQTVRP